MVMQDYEILVTVITAAFALVSPVVIQWRKSPDWKLAFKVGLPILVSVIIAVVYLWFSGGFFGLGFLEAFLVFYGLQQLVYGTIVKNLMSSSVKLEAGDLEHDALDMPTTGPVQYDEDTGVMITGYEEKDSTPPSPGYAPKHSA